MTLRTKVKYMNLNLDSKYGLRYAYESYMYVRKIFGISVCTEMV